MKKLSIVIPCYNCEKTINRLLDSIIFGGLLREQYEVIVCNDKSTDSTLDKIHCYEDKMDIVYCTTTREVHCPGNTRQAALPYISGEWFTFIDNDDMFEPKALAASMKFIDEYNLKYILNTNFRAFDGDAPTREYIGEDADTWLHGKFFNKHNILNVFGCRFKDDLFSHEDVYFNSTVLAKLISIGEDYVHANIFTYRWMNNPESLSRSYTSNNHLYIEEYLPDYIAGSSDPFFDLYEYATTNHTKGFAIHQVMMTLLHAYFYYQASVYRLGSNRTLESSYDAIRKLKRRIISTFDTIDVDIIEYIYKLPELYHSIRGKSFQGAIPFIEAQSFRDFILNL